MPAGLNKTKRRIASIKSTAKITKAMEMIATVKLRRFRNAVEEESLYSGEYVSMMSDLFLKDKGSVSHYGRSNEGDLPTLYLVISSNLGLCGSYNGALFKFVDQTVGEDDVIAPIGQKAINHYSHEERRKVISDFSSIGLSSGMLEIHGLAMKLKESFNRREYKNIVIIYTHYVNSLKFVPTCFELLPVQIRKGKAKNEADEPEYDDSPRAMIHRLMPYYLTSEIYDRLMQSQLSEQASRRTAMENANDNADELLAKLTVEYNKARQNAITQEITEVVGGANANSK